MQTIKVTIPKIINEYFMYVAPAPSAAQVNKFDLMQSREVIEIDTGTTTILAERHSWTEFPFKFMGDYICKLAYGLTEKEMQNWLNQRFKNLHPDSKIAFYLFKKVNQNIEMQSKPKPKHKIGLPLAV